MSFECQFCKKMITSKSNLLKHQKTAKHCIAIQERLKESDPSIKIERIVYKCEYCNKEFSAKPRLCYHLQTCNLRQNIIVKDKDNRIRELEEKLLESEERIKNIEQKHLVELQNKLQEIAIIAIEQKNEVISNMIKKYVKKQPRQQFDCSNVIYILTTSSLKKDRRYILGKAKNLTSRLSTYNKTDEHEVIYYQDCQDEETMNTLEPLVFKKLSEYREQANREMFILPDNSNINLFIDTIKNCFEFLK